MKTKRQKNQNTMKRTKSFWAQINQTNPQLVGRFQQLPKQKRKMNSQSSKQFILQPNQNEFSNK